MNKIRFAELAAIAVGFLVSAALAAVQAQNSPPSSTFASTQGSSALPALTQDSSRPASAAPHSQQVPFNAMRTAPQGQPASANDDLAGFTLTEDQKAKIDQIRKDMKARMEIVAKDPKETEEQKSAMIQGLQRMQRNQIYMVLTPEQQSEFRKKISAQRAAEQDARKRQQGPQPR